MSPLTNSKGLTSLETNSSPGTTGTISPRPSDVPARRQRRTARSKKARSKSVEVSKSLSSKEESAASPTERVLKDLVAVVVSGREGKEVKGGGVTVEMDGSVDVRVGRETSEVALRRRARIFLEVWSDVVDGRMVGNKKMFPIISPTRKQIPKKI